jgi:hypothetical protein
MTRYSYTGDPIPEAVAEAMDEVDAAHNAVATAAYYVDRDVEGAYADLVAAREWRDAAEARYTAALAAA